MKLAELIGLILLIAVVLAIVVIAIRRHLLTRSGGFDVSWRHDLEEAGRGWSLGQGRYRGGELDLYRSFSPLPIAAKTLYREKLVIGPTRAPAGTEPDLLPVGAMIVRCTDGGAACELAMSESALTGLRSWVEASPPGSRSTPGDGATGLKQY
jgi:hypothetical protein